MDYMGGSAPDQITIVSSSIWNLSALSDEFNSLDIYKDNSVKSNFMFIANHVIV